MGIGDWVSGLFGSKNEERAKGYEVDSNAYEYGGRPGGAAEEAARLQGRSDEASAGMGAATRDAGAMYQQAYQDRANAQQARGMQMDAAGMARARAMGQVPSIAQMQADRQMQQAAAAQTSAAASARGPGALALAQQNAAGNTATAQGNIAGQAQIAAAQERLAAEQAYAQQSGAIRGQDYAGQGLSFQGAGQQQQFALGLGNQALGWSQQQQAVNQAQLAAQQNREAQKSANALGAQGINAGVGGQNASMDQQNAMGVMGMAQSAAGTIAGAVSDRNAKITAGDVVAATWGKGTTPSAADQAAAQTAVDAAGTKREMPIFTDPSAEDRQNAAGGGFMLGQQLGTAVYGGRAQGSLPSSVAAGMKSTGAAPKQENAKDEAKGKDASAKQAEAKSKLASILDEAGERYSKGAAQVDTSYHGGHGYAPPQLLSDMNAKIPAFGRPARAAYDFEKTANSPIAPVGGASFDVMSGGGMDVGATDAKHKAFGTRFATNPIAGTLLTSDMTAKTGATMPSDMTGKVPTMPSDMVGKTFSDERSKFRFGQPDAGGPPVLGLDDPGLRVSDEGRGYIAKDTANDLPKLSAGDVVAEQFKPKSAPKKAHGSAPRKMTDDELLRWGQSMLGSTRGQAEGQLGNGPAVRPDGSTMVSDKRAKAQAWDEGYAAATGDVQKMAQMDPARLKEAAGQRPIAAAFRDAKAQAWDEGNTANAARALKSEPYVYKPGMTPPEQAPGELNVGPMAQRMAADPVAGTAVVKQPNGLLAIDIPKYTKVLGAVAAGQQEQIDEQEAKLSRLAMMVGGKR